MKISGKATLAQLNSFDEIIDVRTPAEYAEDHIPGAINCPVLSNEERIEIGTINRQVSAFAARRHGASLISARISAQLTTCFSLKPNNWRPLVYCWRGGNRSGAMTHVLNQIGWRACQLDGGYKSYRKHVLNELNRLPEMFSFRILCGATGTGKSQLLNTLEKRGLQVINLEKIANHRGSVLGGFPNILQPSQKWFETLLWHALSHLDPRKCVYIESESRKIGQLQLPQKLIETMWNSQCIHIDAPMDARVELLMKDYSHLIREPDLLRQSLNRLFVLYGHEKINYWMKLIDAKNFKLLVNELINIHYDPAYKRTLAHNYFRLKDAFKLTAEGLDPKHFEHIADFITSLPENERIMHA
ncbi:MAG TPA: tRNA 2-selenouridine(34) synthase MnmH [Burkholderiales bacterium]|nr:tRNA 2-selenouridine(34) synthase MnmH [Burkholderiales bacterium]